MKIRLQDLTFVGRNLNRPECVLATRDGTLFYSDWAGGVTCIGPDNRRDRIMARAAPWLRPNGIALSRNGTFLVAHLGNDAGGVYRLGRDGSIVPVVTDVDGQALPPTNYVMEDASGRIWITVSTRLEPRHRAWRADVADGFIVLMDRRGARVVADGLGYTNEVQLDATGRWLYVNETFGRRLSRFRVDSSGNLTDRETLAEFGPGTFPDGLAFDAEGGAWITSIISNRLIRVAPDGTQQVVLEDSDPDHLARVEDAYRRGAMERTHLDRIESRRLASISSLAFGGPDLRTAYLGCLLGTSIGVVRLLVAGRAPIHWAMSV